jgi:hypothetical protein
MLFYPPSELSQNNIIYRKKLETIYNIQRGFKKKKLLKNFHTQHFSISDLKIKGEKLNRNT